MSKMTRYDVNDEPDEAPLKASVGDVDVLFDRLATLTKAAVRSHELFVDLVRRMRAAQSKWIYSSDATALRESKKLEREVDNWLEPFDGRIP